MTREPNGRYRIETVADARGLRPWSTPPQPRENRTRSEPKPAPGTPPRFPTDLTTASKQPDSNAAIIDEPPELRPEIEDAGP